MENYYANNNSKLKTQNLKLPTAFQPFHLPKMFIQDDISLKQYNTFQINAKARFFVEVKKEEDIHNLITNEVRTHHPHIIIGEGANLLFTKDYDGLVVKISLKGREIKHEDGYMYVKVGAGEDWHETMMWILEHGYV